MEVKTRKAAGFLLGWTGNLVIFLAVAICLSLIIPRAAGYRTYIVISGSMEPAIPVGSIVYSAETDPETVEKGDVIVFTSARRGDTPITHRVVSNDTSSRTIITKGDANEREDVDPVKYENVKGKVSMHIPYLGHLVSSMTTGKGRIVTLILLIAAWTMGEAGRRLRRKSN